MNINLQRLWSSLSINTSSYKQQHYLQVRLTLGSLKLLSSPVWLDFCILETVTHCGVRLSERLKSVVGFLQLLKTVSLPRMCPFSQYQDVVAMCSLDNTVIWIPINFRHCKRRCTSPVNYGLQPSLCNKSLHDKVTWTTQLAACCIHRKWPPGSYMYYSTNCHDPETAKQLHCTAYYANVFVPWTGLKIWTPVFFSACHTHTRTRARMHARTHTRAHTHTRTLWVHITILAKIR